MSAAVADVLRKARALVAKGWTQGVYARDAAGKAVAPEDSAAVCWCIEGAIAAAGWSESRIIAAETAVSIAVDADLQPHLPVWQDAKGRTQAEVLDAFDRAIAAEEATP